MNPTIFAQKELENCLERENQLFQAFSLEEEQLIRLVQQKKWAEVDELLSRLKQLSGEIELAEEQREEAFSRLCGQIGCKRETTLGSLVKELDPVSAGKLTSLQLQLKEIITKVRSLSDGVLLYSKYMRNTIDDILKEIFPHRKGKIYSSQGKAHTMPEGPVVLDAHF